jgi:hypothetical protein
MTGSLINARADAADEKNLQYLAATLRLLRGGLTSLATLSGIADGMAVIVL